MTLAKREKLLIGALVVVLLFAGARTLIRLASGGELGLPLGIGSSARRAAARGLDIEVAELRLADLDQHSRKLVLGRDPFRFGAPPRPPAPPPPPPEQRRPPERAQPPPPAGPQPPPINLDYLGSFGPARRKIAVFSDGETIHNAMTGEILAGKFIVHQIGYESVDLKFVGFPEVPAERLAAGG